MAGRLSAPVWQSSRPVFTPTSASYLLCDLHLVAQPLCASFVKWEDLFTCPRGLGRSDSHMLSTSRTQGEALEEWRLLS